MSQSYMAQTNRLAAALALLLFILPIFKSSSLQLGDGTTTNSSVFIKVLEDVKDVCCKDALATYAIKNDGSLWGTGEGLLVNGKRVASDSFIKMMDGVLSFDGTFLLRSDGTLWKLPYNEVEFIFVDRNVKKFSHSFYIKDDASLWGYGYDDHYRGFRTVESYSIFGERPRRCKPVKLRDGVVDLYSRGGIDLQIVTNMGEFWEIKNEWNVDTFAQELKLKRIYVRSTGEGTFIITRGDELFGFGFASYGSLGVGRIGEGRREMPFTKVMEDVKSVSTTDSATLILKNDGILYGCGGASKYYVGELGLGNREAYWTPPQYIMDGVVKVSVGFCHSAIIKEDGSLWTCGANNVQDASFL